MAASSDRNPARLVLHQPSGEELVYALEQGRTVTIGRDGANTIALNSQFVSKRHALVSWGPRGVRIEDQDSANGITVNGLTVHAAQLSGGDVVQIGDQRITFELEGQAAPASPHPSSPAAAAGNKGLRLVLVAMLTMLLMIGGLMAAYLFVLRPADQTVVSSSSVRQREDPSLPADTAITPFDSPEAQVVAKRALASKAEPADWLYDEGVLAYSNGRMLDAYRLLHAVLHRDPSHAPARRQLLRVMGDRELRLRGLQAAAQRAEEEMKFEEAARHWEQVLAMTLDTEPMYARAKTEASRLHQRAGAR